MEIQSHIPPAPNEYDQVWIEQQLNRMQQELYSRRGSGDMTFTGGLEIDGSVDFSSPMWFDDSVDVQGLLACASDVTVTGTLSCASDAGIAGDFSVDGTTVLSDTVLSGDVTFTFDPIAGETGPTAKIFGDWSTRAIDTTYSAARTDGFVVCYVVVDDPTAMTIQGQTPAGTIVVSQRSAMDNTGTSLVLSVTFPVKNGDTWAVRGIDTTTYNSSSVLWIPFFDNT